MAVELKRLGGCGSILLIALAALVGAGGYHLWSLREDPLATGSLVTGFQRQNELTVFAAQVVTVSTSRIDGLIDALDREQTAIIPAQVRYTIDLSRMRAQDVAWDATARRMTVTVPPVLVQRPDVQEQRARYFDKGLLPGTADTQTLTRSNSIKAGREALTLARNPEFLRLAEQSGRDAIASNARLYLSGAGIKDADVVVRFATEGRRSPEQWDRSKRPEEVIGNAN